MTHSTGFERSLLWLCADVEVLAPRDALDRCVALCDRVAREGIPTHRVTLWLRNASRLAGRDALSLSRSLRALTAERRAHFVIGERADLAVLSGADAVHVTHAGPCANDVARFLAAQGADAVAMSAAVHDPHEARTAAVRCAALLAAPFGVVPGKSAPLGVSGLSAIVASAPGRSVIALGGIDDEASVRAAFASGAQGVAARRPLLAKDAAAALAPLLAAIAQHIA